MQPANETFKNYYHPLLLRYALFRVKNKLIAFLIVNDVLLTCSTTPTPTKQFLKLYTYEKCDQWLQAKAEVLNLRKPKNPT